MSRDGCDYCMQNNKMCQTCKLGYYRDIATSVCLPNSDPNCNSLDAFSKKCSWCKMSFYFDDKLDRCISCDSADRLCTRCQREDKNVNDKLVCETCIHGFTVSQETGKCVKCPDHCLGCSVDLKCYSCAEGFYQDLKGRCVRKSNLDCLYQSDNKCVTCKNGYFLDS